MTIIEYKALKGEVLAQLRGMSQDEKIGQLLCWDISPAWVRGEPGKIMEVVERYHVGSLFVFDCKTAETTALTSELDRRTRIPVLIASDLEHGAAPAIRDGVEFPFLMAVGAANDEKLAEEMGRATAREGSAAGVQWTFSPVVDINFNPANPVVNVRSLGDDPARVARLAAAYIRGIQRDNLMAATAKHFPGDGVDDRDQHLCTSVNSFSRDKWHRTFGRVWKNVIREDVMSIMVGHIALPFKDKGRGFIGGIPATLSRKVQIDLLKNELGFRGCIVSDALPMVGISSHVKLGELAARNIAAGSDVALFCDPERDFKAIKRAVADGMITGARLDDAVMRVLMMKARLGCLVSRRSFEPVTAQERAGFESTARAIADKAATLARNVGGILPLRLSKGSKVLTITLQYDSGSGQGQDQSERYRELTVIDEALRERGIIVEHAHNNTGPARSGKFDAVFLNVRIIPHCFGGTIRMVGPLAWHFWNSLIPETRNLVVTAFGNPYLVHEIPSAPAMLLMYDYSPAGQRAAVASWLGENPIRGRSPVSLAGKPGC